MMVTYTDNDGSVWELEEKDRFSEDWNPDIIDEVFGRALVKVRRAGEFGGVWMRAPAKWDTEPAMRQLVEVAKASLRRQ